MRGVTHHSQNYSAIGYFSPKIEFGLYMPLPVIYVIEHFPTLLVQLPEKPDLNSVYIYFQ